MAFLDYSGLSRFLDKLKALFVTGPSSSTGDHIATFNGTGGKTIKDSGYTIATSVPANAVFTDTTYSSQSASSGGTDVSLCTTGEKYTWNNKLNSNQGSANNGKYMKVGSDGALAPDNIPESTAIGLTATSSGWSNTTPSTQTLAATGVTSSNNINVGIGGSVTSAQLEAIAAGNILCTAQGTNSITLTCFGEVPEINIPINVIILN